MEFLKKTFSSLWGVVWKTPKFTEKNIIIAVIGHSGAGMSSLIHAVTNNYEYGVGKKGVLQSYTRDVCPIKIQSYQDIKSTVTDSIILLDTPGIDGHRKTSRMVSNDVERWMAKNCQPNVKLGGIIYVNNITNSMDLDTKPDIFITEFQVTKLCGENWRNKIRLVNTHWDVGGSDMDFEEKEIKERLWGQKMQENLHVTTEMDKGTRVHNFALHPIVYRFSPNQNHDLVQELIFPLIGVAPKKEIAQDNNETRKLLSSVDHLDSSATIIEDSWQVNKAMKHDLGVGKTPVMDVPCVTVADTKNNLQLQQQGISRLKLPPSSAKFHIL